MVGKHFLYRMQKRMWNIHDFRANRRNKKKKIKKVDKQGKAMV